MDLQALINQSVAQTKPQGTPISSETEKREIKTEITNLETATANDEGSTPSQAETETKQVEKELSVSDLADKFEEDMRLKYKGKGKYRGKEGTLSRTEFKDREFQVTGLEDGKDTGKNIYDKIRAKEYTYNLDTQEVSVVGNVKKHSLRIIDEKTGKTTMQNEVSEDVIQKGLKTGTIVKESDGNYRITTVKEQAVFDAKQSEQDLKEIVATDTPEYKNSQVATPEYVDTKVPEQSSEKTSSYTVGNTIEGMTMMKALQELLKKDNSVSPSNPVSNATLNSMKRKAIEKEKEPVGWDNFYTTEKVNGKEVQTVSEDFTTTLLESDFDENSNIESIITSLTSYITHTIIEKYGYSGITEIEINDNRIFINNNWFKPTLDSNADYSHLPKGEYLVWIGQGRVANFFDWKYISRFKNLYSIKLDDAKYIHTVVAHTACRNGQAGVNTFFRLSKSLQELTVNGKTVTREGLNTPEALEIKQESGRAKRSFNLLNGWTLNNRSFLENTDSVQNFGISSFTNYIHNRGNRGFIRFAVGSTLRFGLAAVTTTFNLGSHLVGGVVNTFRDATTPIDESEI